MAAWCHLLSEVILVAGVGGTEVVGKVIGTYRRAETNIPGAVTGTEEQQRSVTSRRIEVEFDGKIIRKIVVSGLHTRFDPDIVAIRQKAGRIGIDLIDDTLALHSISNGQGIRRPGRQ